MRWSEGATGDSYSRRAERFLRQQLRGEHRCNNSVSEGNMGNLKKSLRKKALLHKDSLKHHLQDYCESTSIHGVKYLGNTTNSLEKAWWAAMLACCVIGNAYLIHKVWVKWNNSPVIVSFAETAMPIWEIPFPTITLCSSIKSDVDTFSFTKHINQLAKNIEEGEDYLKDISEGDFKSLSDMSLLCDDHVFVENAEEFTNESAIEFLMDVAPELNETSLVCQFGDDPMTNCSDFFTKLFLDEGVCYAFNMLSPSQLFDQSEGWNRYFEDHSMESSWSLEGGYSSESDLFSSYPRRVLSAGSLTSMSILLQYRPRDFDNHCRGPVGGFKVLLNNPAEFPLSRELFWRSPPGEELILMVQPRIMTTSDGLRPYNPKIRQCYFQNERKLRYFNVYTQRNCEVECLTNFTLANCGCVAYYMPRNESTPLCGGGKKACMLNAQKELRTLEIEAVRKASINSDCHCLQACQSIQFNAESSQSQLQAGNVLTAYGDNVSEIDGFQISRIKIYFKDKQFIASRRSELFGMADFLANCGGLLGLFCGISILSICELVYYITIRFWANFRIVKKKHESMEKDDGAITMDNPNDNLRASLKMN